MDCDDDDPDVHQRYFRDADGDGFGDLDSPDVACGGDEAPPGYGGYRDCDDDDPQTYWDALDLWDDGVDQSCDGVDYQRQWLDDGEDAGAETPPRCRSHKRAREFEPPAGEGCQDGPDLRIADVIECLDCPSTGHLQIANGGGVAARGTLELEVEQGTARHLTRRASLQIDLAPGEAILVHATTSGGQYSARLRFDGDCDTSNDSATFNTAFVDCFAL